MTLEHRKADWRYPDAPDGTCRGCGRPCSAGSRSHPACKVRHSEEYDHRKAMFRRHRGHPVCVDHGLKGMGPCQGKIESDHVEPLADGGDKAWTVPRCKRHHDMKTKREAAARRIRRRGATMGKNTVPVEQSGTNWGMVGFAGLLIAEAALLLLGHTYLAIALPLVLIALGIAGVLLARAQSRRADARARLGYAIAGAMRFAPEQVRVVTKGRSGSAKYWVTAADVPGSPFCRDVEAVITRKVGGPLAFTWHPATDRVEWEPTDRAEPEGETTVATSDPGGVQARVHEALSGFIKGESVLTVIGQPDAIGPLSMRLAYPASVRDDSDDVRAAIVSIVNHKAPGRWRATWDTEGNRALFERRPPMPTMVPHPAPTDADQTRLPFATGEDQDVVAWDLSVAPHALVAGETGSGKTIAIRSIVAEAAARGFEVMICDPKRIEMRGFRDWPNVTAVATSTEDMTALVDLVHRIMDERYIDIEADPAARAGLHPILLVVDELREWLDRVNVAHRVDIGRASGDHPVVERWRSITRLGRGARIHVLVGIQRPDAKVFSGEARDNYGARMALGSLSEQGARMMFGASDVGRDVPDDAKGRATVDVGGGVREVQVWWTPDPREHTEDDEALLDALRPAEALYPERALEDAARPGTSRKRPTPRKRAARGWRMVDAEKVDHGDHVRSDDGVEADVIDVMPVDDDPDSVDVNVTLPGGAETTWRVPVDSRMEVAST